MKGYVKLRRGIAEHFKVMSPSELKIYVGLLLLADYKKGSVNTTIAKLADFVALSYKWTQISLHRLEAFGYVAITLATNQWQDNKIEIIKYNGSVNKSDPASEPHTEPHTGPHTTANDITSDNSKDLQIPKKLKEVKRSIKKVLSANKFVLLLKNNPAYSHINIDFELGKMDAWLLVHPGRQKTKRFIVRWLNRIEKPMAINKPKERIL